MTIRDTRIGADIPRIEGSRKAWFVWCSGINGPYPSVFYDALPTSHDGKRSIISDPRPLEGEDYHLPLRALMAKYPPPKGTDK